MERDLSPVSYGILSSGLFSMGSQALGLSWSHGENKGFRALLKLLGEGQSLVSPLEYTQTTWDYNTWVTVVSKG